ncbi:MAG: aldo/keto reductase [Deltaproteobacteria bacterium]|nr:aldo/keto reductase [Deltaproteobacteria bacterium]
MKNKKEISRRQFLRTAGAVGAGSFLTAAGAVAQVSQEPGETKAEPGKVPTRPFGKTGVNVSILSLGGMFDIPSNQLLLRQALKWGVTHWDTADCYEGGKSELGIGQFLTKFPEARKEIFLVTKSDARDPQGMTQLLERSLERMKTDTIDLYFIHGMKRINELDNNTRIWVDNAKKAGKIRFFGFSTHTNMEDLMVEAAKLGWIDAIMMTYNFRIMHQDKMKAAVDACTKAGIGLTAMKTQGGGSMSVESEAELEMGGKFLKEGYTDKQAKIKAIWQNPLIANVCSQMPNMTILMSNIAAALNQTKLSGESMDWLRRYAEETASTYCAGCADLCESAAEDGIPIREVMRYLMYYNSYGECDRARSLYAELPSEMRERLAQMDFSGAERRCPRKLQIGRFMRQAATLLG